jgi:leader peptidase (prepilin peptidase)/N-methyltransferase
MFPAAALLVVVALTSTLGTVAFAPALYLAVATPLLTVIDLREHRLPHGIVLPGYGAAALGLATAVAQGRDIWPALACGLGGIIVFGVLAVTGGMGMGDVTLAGLLAFAAGLVSPAIAFSALLVALVLGAVAAVVAARQSRSAVPFGPFLLAGYWVTLAASSVAP